MKLLKIIDATLYETEPRKISDHLELVLKDIRKRNFTASVIGDPDEADGLCAMDVGAFSDELTYGHELSRNEEKRILARATKLAKAREAAGGLSHLKREECERLEPSLRGMRIIMAKDVNWADEVAAKLHEDMPWMGRATEYVWHALRRSAQRGEPITLRPVMAKLRVHLKGVHRVRKTLADGTRVEYHYAWRSGPRIWDQSKLYGQNSIEYVEAFRAALNAHTQTKGTFQDIVDAFFASSEFLALGDRTKKDHWYSVARDGGIEAEFGKAPISAFEDRRIRPQILKWRDQYAPGTGDRLISTMQRIVSFAYERGLLSEHHLLRVKKPKKSNRAGIIWTQAEIDQFVEGAPRYLGRILVAAVETGLRPGDLQILCRKDIERTKGDHGRIMLRTKKSRGNKYASIPITRSLAALIDTLPDNQERIIVASDGANFNNPDSMGRAISKWRDILGIRKELRLYDARGTAVTRLVRAGCTLSELATHMGWSFQHAAQMLEKYAALDPDMADGILEKVERRERLNAGEPE
mgnify:CR=1 FL=1